MELMLSNVTVRFERRDLGFVANDRGVIDATAFFDTPEFKDPAVNWNMPGTLEVRAIILHHFAGWFGKVLGRTATESEEFAELVALARYHRETWGIGPAYNYVAFHSGRVWAVGRHGTHRAHTKGRDPISRRPWNEVGRAVVVPGDLNKEPMTIGLGQAITRAVQDALALPGVIADCAIHEHGLTPTVNSAGVKFSQATECPGRNLSQWRAAGGLRLSNAPSAPPSFEPEPAARVWSDGYRKGRAAQAREDHDALAPYIDDLLDTVANPPAPAPTAMPTTRFLQELAS